MAVTTTTVPAQSVIPCQLPQDGRVRPGISGNGAALNCTNTKLAPSPRQQTLANAFAVRHPAPYLEEPVAFCYHVGQALRGCQVVAQLLLVRLPQAAFPLA